MNQSKFLRLKTRGQIGLKNVIFVGNLPLCQSPECVDPAPLEKLKQLEVTGDPLPETIEELELKLP